MQIYNLESCRTIEKEKFSLNWIYSVLYIWSSDHSEMRLADAGCDNDPELGENIWPQT